VFHARNDEEYSPPPTAIQEVYGYHKLSGGRGQTGSTLSTAKPAEGLENIENVAPASILKLVSAQQEQIAMMQQQILGLQKLIEKSFEPEMKPLAPQQTLIESKPVEPASADDCQYQEGVTAVYLSNLNRFQDEEESGVEEKDESPQRPFTSENEKFTRPQFDVEHLPSLASSSALEVPGDSEAADSASLERAGVTTIQEDQTSNPTAVSAQSEPESPKDEEDCSPGPEAEAEAVKKPSQTNEVDSSQTLHRTGPHLVQADEVASKVEGLSFSTQTDLYAEMDTEFGIPRIVALKEEPSTTSGMPNRQQQVAPSNTSILASRGKVDPEEEWLAAIEAKYMQQIMQDKKA